MFFPGSFQDFLFFFFSFQKYSNGVSYCGFLWVFMYRAYSASWMCRFISLKKFLEVSSYFIFEYFFSLTLFLPSSRDSSDMNVQVPESLMGFFTRSFPLSSNLLSSIFISSSSPIYFFVPSILLLIPSPEHFVLVTVFFPVLKFLIDSWNLYFFDMAFLCFLYFKCLYICFLMHFYNACI